jgi:arylsulfatase
LAAQSIRLADFHVAPVCTPTRAQLLTGLDALRTGATDATGQRHLLKRGLRTIADYFAGGGYRTALYGKWHLGGNFIDFRPHERGFQDAVHFLRGGVQSHPNHWNSDLFDDFLYHNGRLQQFPGYATDVWFDLAEKFVTKCAEDGQPFFLYLPLNAPHGPLLVPDHFREPYRALDKETATFFGMIASVDHRLPGLLKLLSARGLRENTIVVFLTDNGTANGERVFNAGMRGKKGALYEGGHRVPCWISWPGGDLVAPQVIDVLSTCQDLLPTLLDLCGIQAGDSVRFDGTSLAPSLRGTRQPELDERIVVLQRSEAQGQAAVMWRKWRKVANELFDLQTDPSQTTDVRHLYPDVVKRLESHYETWWAGVKEGLTLERYRLGADDDTVMLTAYDWWYGRRVYNWPHLRRGDTSNGRYEVLIDRAGRYEVALRRWPRESGLGIRDAVERFVPKDAWMAYDDALAPFPPGPAYEIVGAKVRLGDQTLSCNVQPTDREALLQFDLQAGPADLQTWFRTKDGSDFGASYVYIRRIK